MSARALAVGMAALAMCCAPGPGEIDADMASPEEPGTALAAVEADAPEPPCAVAFDVPPELRAQTERAAERWSAATGCDVRIDEGGIPIVVLDEILEADGSLAIDSTGGPVRARTKTVWIDGELTTARIEYRRDAAHDAGRIIPHEMGHALGGYGHTDTGLLRATPANWEPIDAASLSLVCERLACAEFSTEFDG